MKTKYQVPKLSITLLVTNWVQFICLEHIFAEDGGAESIAGIPLSSYSSEAANNIVSIFAQWGFSQLVLACILLLIVLKLENLFGVANCCFRKHIQSRNWSIQVFNH